MNESLQQFDKALNRLEEVLQRSAEHDTIILDATIQRFEFSMLNKYCLQVVKSTTTVQQLRASH
jgi:hypothetical protein